MKIGIISASEKNKKTQIEKICDFGAVELYRLDVCLKRKGTLSKRIIKHLVKTLEEQGITICVADKEFSVISGYGITVVCDGRDVVLQRAGQAAMLFAERNGIDADFLIDGGSFNNVCLTSLFLLREKRRIYIKNAAFYEISEEIFHETGAVVGCDEPEKIIRISMNSSEQFISSGKLFASLCDFRVVAEELDFGWLSEENKRALVSILEKSGFLEKKRVKIEYFLK
ncbi:MAG: hypothetical protein IJO09_07935 [Oscillospiraceae bacterium]|nr:hypothetical protein [Oscillospiraceae bacterium]